MPGNYALFVNNLVTNGPIILAARAPIVCPIAARFERRPQGETPMSNYDTQQALDFFRARMTFTTGVHELDSLVQQGKGDFRVVDVRFPSDFAKGHVPGAVSLPKGKWHTARGLTKEGLNYLYCYNQTCHLAAEAAIELAAQGYKVVEVEGGWAAWEANGYRIENAAQAA
jgi:rhodanese-related sulfurtransferase